MPLYLELIYGLLFGACWGSFISCATSRLPLIRGGHTFDGKHLSLAYPGSFCDSCQKPVPLYFNIPVLSWVILRGRSACCQQKIPARFLMSEIIYGAIGVSVVLLFGLTDLSLYVALGLILLSGLGVCVS